MCSYLLHHENMNKYNSLNQYLNKSKITNGKTKHSVNISGLWTFESLFMLTGVMGSLLIFKVRWDLIAQAGLLSIKSESG